MDLPPFGQGPSGMQRCDPAAVAVGHKHDRFYSNLIKICLLLYSQTIMPSIPITTRAQIVTLKALGYTNEDICSKLYLSLAHRSLD